MFHSTENIRDFPVKDEDREIGKVWGFVIDRYSWQITHMVVNTGDSFEGRSILVSRKAFLKPILQNEIIAVSLAGDTGQGDYPIDLNSSPYITILKKTMDTPKGWALIRPTPLPSFPMPMVSSFYVKAQNPSIKDDIGDDTQPMSCRDLIKKPIQARDGSVGCIDDLLVDDDCRNIRYTVVDTGRWLPGRKTTLSTLWLEHAGEDDRTLVVDLPAKKIKNGPEYDPTVPMSRELEIELFEYYDRKPYWL